MSGHGQRNGFRVNWLNRMRQFYEATFLRRLPATLEVDVDRMQLTRSSSSLDLRLEVTAVLGGQRFPCQFGVPGNGYVGAEPLCELLSRADLNVEPEEFSTALKHSTPFLDADWSALSGALRLRRVHRLSVHPGQGFLRKTLAQCIATLPQVDSVFLDYITHTQTRDLVLPVLLGERPASSLPTSTTSSALVNALVHNGYGNIAIVRQGRKDFALRGTRAQQTTWHM